MGLICRPRPTVDRTNAIRLAKLNFSSTPLNTPGKTALEWTDSSGAADMAVIPAARIPAQVVSDGPDTANNLRHLPISGPAGSGKTQEARRLLDAAAGPMLAADFQSILAALLLLERLPNGRYPNRNPAQAAWLLPMVEAVRQTVITIATDREIDVVTTNSDGSPARRAFLLSRLGPGSVETILDPGIDVVTQRPA